MQKELACWQGGICIRASTSNTCIYCDKEMPMLRNLYALRDVKIGEYMNLIMLKNKEEAQRYFGMVITDQRGPCSKFPRDYAIHHLGSMDSDAGTINPNQPVDVTPYSVVDELELKNKEKPHGSQ